MSVSDKGRSTPQTVTRISCEHLPAPSKSPDQHTGKTWPLLRDAPSDSAKANKGRQQAQAVHLPWTGPCSVFWSDTNRVHLSQGLVLRVKLQSGLWTRPPPRLFVEPHPRTLLSLEAGFGCAASARWYHQFVCGVIFARSQKNKSHVKDTVKIWSEKNATVSYCCVVRKKPKDKAKCIIARSNPSINSSAATSAMERMRQETSPRAGVSPLRAHC